MKASLTDKRSFTWLRLPRRKIKRRRVAKPAEMVGYTPEWSLLQAIQHYQALRSIEGK